MPTLDRDGAGRGPTIRGFASRGYRIDETVSPGGVILTPDAALHLDAETLDALDAAVLAPVLAMDPRPEFLLLGTGASMRRPSPAFTALLDGAGIGLEPMPSRAAARAWGVLRAEDRRIAAILLPTDA